MGLVLISESDKNININNYGHEHFDPKKTNFLYEKTAEQEDQEPGNLKQSDLQRWDLPQEYEEVYIENKRYCAKHSWVDWHQELSVLRDELAETKAD